MTDFETSEHSAFHHHPDAMDLSDDPRAQARKHIEKRRGLQASLLSYVVINAFVVGIWLVAGGGYFWPGWLMAAWGIGIIFQVWDYFRRPVTEADVDAEMRRTQQR